VIPAASGTPLLPKRVRVRLRQAEVEKTTILTNYPNSLVIRLRGHVLSMWTDATPFRCILRL